MSGATKAPSLPDLQGWMRGVLTDPKGVHHALYHSRHPGARRHLRVIGETPDVGREQRLAIYGNGYFSRLIDCLGANYPSLKSAMGETAFEAFARAYLDRHPSTSQCIDDVGSEMPVFLRRRPESRATPYLPDLAALEWAVHTAYYADDRPALDPKTLNAPPPDRWQRARFVFDPSVRLLAVQWPVDRLWRADGKLTPPLRRLLKKTPVYLLVYRRPDKQVRVTRLEPASFRLLRSLLEGRSLAQSLARLKRAGAGTIQAWFQDWFSRGLVQRIDGLPSLKTL